MTKQDVKTSVPKTHKDAMRCYLCDGTEQRSAQAKHYRHEMSRLVVVAGLITLNVGHWDMKFMSAK